MRPRDRLLRQGIESQPGPASVFEFINPTFLKGTNAEFFVNRDATCTATCEHSCTKKQARTTKSFFKKHGFTSFFSGLDPELNHASGGVSAQARKPNSIYQIKPKTKAANSLLASGRFGIFGVDLGFDLHVVFLSATAGPTVGARNLQENEQTT